MPMWFCDVQGCQAPSVRTLGECILCNRHLCCKHLEKPYHSCPEWEDEDNYDPAAAAARERDIAHLLDQINVAALLSVASQLRGGIECSAPQLTAEDRAKNCPSSIMGGMNYHVDICFDDGVVWVARIRRVNATSPPLRLRNSIVQSEAATLRFLEQCVPDAPTPRVYDCKLEGQAGNSVGVGYILMEKLPGHSLRWKSPDMDETKRLRFARQLAAILTALSEHSWDQMGSLGFGGGQPDMSVDPSRLYLGPMARESLTDAIDSETMHPGGPFSSAHDYYRYAIGLVLDLVRRREMYTQRPVDAYLIHLFLLDLVPVLFPSSSSSSSPKFYLKHADDKGDHILVDDDYNITGIIDWEWAHTAPPEIAFNSPVGLLPVNEFYDGVGTIGDDEELLAQCFDASGHSDLARCVRHGRVQHLFAFCCGYDLVDWTGFLGLFRGLRDAVGVDSDLDWDDWKKVALDRYRAEEGLQKLEVESRALG